VLSRAVDRPTFPMTTNRKLAVAARALVLVTAGAAVHFFFEWRRVRVVVAATAGERDALQAKLTLSEQTLAAAKEHLMEARLQADTLRADLGRLFPVSGSAPSAIAARQPLAPGPSMLPAPPGLTAGSATSGVGNRGNVTMFVPGRYRGPRASFVRTPPSLKSLDTLYPALFRQLRLSPDQAAQFRTLAIELAEQFADLDRRARAEQKRPSDPSLQPLYTAIDSEYRRKLAALIGAEAIPAVEHFAETLFLRDAVAYFASEFYFTDAPVSQAHADRLVEIMAKHLRDPNGRLDHVFADGGAMKLAAQEFLAPVHGAAWELFIDDLARTGFGTLQPRVGPASGMTTR
jgi:hypothetical protein